MEAQWVRALEPEEGSQAPDPAAELAVALVGVDVNAAVRQLALLGFAPDDPICAFRARSRGDGVGLEFEVRRHAGHRRIVVGRIEGDVVGVTAGALAAPIRDSAVGLGDVVAPRRVAESFMAATRALDAVWPTGAVGLFRLDDVALLAAIAYDDDIGERIEHRYLTPTGAMGRLGGEVEATLRALLASDLDVCRASADLGIHPNTTRYRLRQYANASGADLTSLDDLFAIWWALKRRDRRRVFAERAVADSLGTSVGIPRI